MLCSPDTLNEILTEVTDGLRGVLGEKLENVILYGSYARGDADEQSDIDVMVLLKGVPRGELWKYYLLISPVLGRIEEKWEFEILLSVVLEDIPTFEQYSQYMPFFRNVVREGIGFVHQRIC